MTGSFLAPDGGGSTPTRPPRPLTVEQVAWRLGCSAREVRHLIELGRFPGAFRVDVAARSPWRVPLADVEAHIARTAVTVAAVADVAEKAPPTRRRPLAGAKR